MAGTFAQPHGARNHGIEHEIGQVLAQFGAPPIDQAGLEKLRSVPIADTTGAWVEAEGEYASGMGAPPKPGFAGSLNSSCAIWITSTSDLFTIGSTFAASTSSRTCSLPI